MGKHKPPARKMFAISKSRTSSPFFEDRGGIIYTKHYLQRGIYKGKPRWWIVDVEISKEDTLLLIKQFSMRCVVNNQNGMIWDTTPSLKEECKKMGLTYSSDLRYY